MKKQFEKPEIQVVEVSDDIITTSTSLCPDEDTGFVPGQ